MAVKTRPNPKTNRADLSPTRFNEPAASPLINSSTDAPDMYERYAGTNGSTHGEKNDSRPNKNAAGMEIAVDIFTNSPQVVLYLSSD
jgi:hypothetical protein